MTLRFVNELPRGNGARGPSAKYVTPEIEYAGRGNIGGDSPERTCDVFVRYVGDGS